LARITQGILPIEVNVVVFCPVTHNQDVTIFASTLRDTLFFEIVCNQLLKSPLANNVIDQASIPSKSVQENMVGVNVPVREKAT